MPAAGKTCFVIAPIGDPGSSRRRRSDAVLDLLIRPLTEEFGYATERGDEVIGHDYDILVNILARIMEDDLVVADLTEDNPNVFYELAIRHAAAKPLIHLADESRRHDLPFDLDKLSVIYVDPADEGSLERARADLRRQLVEIREGRAATRGALVQLADVLSSLAALLWPPRIEAANLKMAIRSVKRIRKMIASGQDPTADLKALQAALESVKRRAERPAPLRRRRSRPT